MKYLCILPIILFAFISKGQNCYNVELPANRKLVDSLKVNYVDPSGIEKKDSLLREQMFDFPLFYQWACSNVSSGLMSYLHSVPTNIDFVFTEFYFDKNGGLDLFAYRLKPIKGKKITQNDHDLVCGYFKSHKTQIELISAKPHWFETTLIIGPFKSIKGKNMTIYGDKQ